MIISESNQFVFIKGRKVAGTSVEVGLTSLCNRQEILTPITPIDEVVRFRTARLMAQNYGADPDKLKVYRRTIRRIERGDEGSWSEIRKPRGRYLGHMPLIKSRRAMERLPAIGQSSGLPAAPTNKPFRASNTWPTNRPCKSVQTAIDVESNYFQEAKKNSLAKQPKKNYASTSTFTKTPPTR